MINRKNILNAVLVLVSLLLFFALLEISMRFYYAGKHDSSEPVCLQANTERIYSFKADSDVCSTNAKGYMDYDYPEIKQAKRIVVIGDSVATGVGVPFGKSFPKLLEKKLNAIPGSSYEVVVLAVPGYSTSQEISLLKDEAFLYDPDLIIFAYHLNDPAHPLFHNAGSQVGMYFRKPVSYALFYLQRLLFRAQGRLKSMQLNCPQTPWSLYLHCVYWPDVTNSFSTIMALAKEQSTPVLFAFLPLLVDPADDTGLDALYTQLTALATDNGALSISLMQPFKGYDVETVRLSDDPWHPNLKGHQIIAETLYAYLLQENTVLK